MQINSIDTIFYFIYIDSRHPYFLGPSGSSTVSSSFTSSSTLSTLSEPSVFISVTSFSFLGALSLSFFSFCLGGALRFGLGASLKRKYPVTEQKYGADV